MSHVRAIGQYTTLRQDAYLKEIGKSIAWWGKTKIETPIFKNFYHYDLSFRIPNKAWGYKHLFWLQLPYKKIQGKRVCGRWDLTIVLFKKAFYFWKDMTWKV